MDVSVIIVNYHSAEMVMDCIHSIREKTNGITYEVIVVDNASGDGSVETLREAFGSGITLIPSAENLGFGKANNLGATHATGEYLFLLNPDTLLVNNTIKTLFDYLQAHPEVGVAGGNLYAPDMTPAPSFCRTFDDLKSERRRAGWRYILGSKLRDKLSPRPMTEFNATQSPETVAYIFGADMMMKRSLFSRLGGFDPDFFMYAEEEELTWRVTQSGLSAVCVPQAQIIHLEGATVKKRNEFSRRQFKMRMTGTLTYYRKRFGDAGAREFYRLRSLRYTRLIKLAKLQGKLTADFPPAIQKACLDEVYREFQALTGGNTAYGGSK